MGNCGSNGVNSFDNKVKKGILSIDCFEEHRALGKGGFGTVLAVTKKFGPEEGKNLFHAMKRLDKKRIVECKGMDVLVMSELHFMIEISDDNSKMSSFLMKLECAFQDSAHVYLVQSMMEGGDGLFVQNTFKDKKLPLNIAKWFTTCCLLGLESLHEDHNLLHRDIKEENLLIDSNGYAKVADFGMCDKMVDGVSHAHGGTLAYMSPESRARYTDYAQKVTHDLFAVGVMLYKMVSGQLPFGGHDAHDFNTVLQMHLNEKQQKKSTSHGTTLIREEEILLEHETMPEHYKVDDVLLSKACGESEDGVNCMNLIKALVVFMEPVRLGSKNGAKEVLDHAWFKDMDLEAIKRHSVPSPYVPDHSKLANICRGDLDIFEQLAFDGDAKEEKLDPEKDKVFEDFYYNPWHEDDDARSTSREALSSMRRSSSSESSSTVAPESSGSAHKEVLKTRRASKILAGKQDLMKAMELKTTEFKSKREDRKSGGNLVPLGEETNEEESVAST
jgi:serine/threonine protein kinase